MRKYEKKVISSKNLGYMLLCLFLFLENVFINVIKGSRIGNSSNSLSNSTLDRTGLRNKNKILASSLNDTRLQNAALCQRLNELNGQMLELRGEITELKREKQVIAATARATESDIQRKLSVSIFSDISCLQYSTNLLIIRVFAVILLVQVLIIRPL